MAPWQETLRLTSALALFLHILFLPGLGAAGDPSPNALSAALEQVSSERMMADIAALSGPQFHGRQAGTEDDHRSALWVADRFRSMGLSLAALRDRLSMGKGRSSPMTGLMTAPLAAPVVAPDVLLRVGAADSLQTTQVRTDFLPILDSPSADLQAPIVFVGYGTGDDYATVDVNNRVVLFLRGKPDHAARSMSHADKVRLARAKGAIAYLTATGPILNAYEAKRGVTGAPSAFYGQLPASEALPGAWISTRLAETILGVQGGHERLRARQEQLNKNPASQSISTDRYVSLRWQTSWNEGLLANVVALLPGTESDAIVVGAHRDHFGTTAGLVFPGADDNASGTAVMLEVARILAQSGLRPAKTILFVSFSGEEHNLLGSRLYTGRPPVPLTHTKAMINIDHAGVGNGRLTVGVTEVENGLAVRVGEIAGLKDQLDLFGFFPGGDHVPFKEAGVPTITVVSGGGHPHFHQPTDTTDTIDPEILTMVARYVLALTWHTANVP